MQNTNNPTQNIAAKLLIGTSAFLTSSGLSSPSARESFGQSPDLSATEFVSNELSPGAERSIDLVMKEVRTAIRSNQEGFLRERLNIDSEAPSLRGVDPLLEEVNKLLKTPGALRTIPPKSQSYIQRKVEQALVENKIDRKRAACLEVDLLLQEAMEGGRRVRPATIYDANPTPEQKRFVLECNSQAFLKSLESDSIPDTTKKGIGRYQSFIQTSSLIMNGEDTVARAVAVDREAIIEDGIVKQHPRIRFQMTKFFKNVSGQRKSFQMELLQEPFTIRGGDGKISSYGVVSTLVERVPIEKGKEYGFSHLVTCTRADARGPGTILGSYATGAVIDFRGKLQKKGFLSSTERGATQRVFRSRNNSAEKKVIQSMKQHWEARAKRDAP